VSGEIGGPVQGDIERRVRDSFARQGLMGHLGATLQEVRQGLVVIRMPYRPELSQQHGYFHAGGTSAIADSAGGYAGFTLFPENSSVLTVEFKINLLNPARGDFLEAVGRVIKSGRTLTICGLEVFAVTSSEKVLVAVGQQTLICIAGRQDGPAD
jgi:uncharacterized protein (TIGR00369 family)